MCFFAYKSRFSCVKNFQIFLKIFFVKKLLYCYMYPYCRCARWYLFFCAINSFHCTADALLLYHFSGGSGFILHHFVSVVRVHKHFPTQRHQQLLW